MLLVNLLQAMPKETIYVIVSLIIDGWYKICLPELLYPRKLPSNLRIRLFSHYK